MLCATIYEYKTLPSLKDVESSSVSNNNERLDSFSNKNLSHDRRISMGQEEGEGKSLQKDPSDGEKTENKKGAGDSSLLASSFHPVEILRDFYAFGFFSGVWLRCLSAFNPIANGSKILSTEPAATESLTCLHGLRVLSLGWVVMVHTYLQVYAIAGEERAREDESLR